MRIPKLSFEPLNLEHLELLHRWLQEPHVMEFWDDGDRTLEDVRRHYFYRSKVKSWIAHVNGQPFAYVQMYLVSDDSELAPWKCPERATVGIDLFIGEKEFISKRLSAPLINAFIEQCLLNYFPCRILVDPASNNARALRVYKKIGFTEAGVLKSKEKTFKILQRDSVEAVTTDNPCP
jgi:RimJ/RimL family protein N-acetyltransferase